MMQDYFAAFGWDRYNGLGTVKKQIPRAVKKVQNLSFENFFSTKGNSALSFAAADQR
jgi:hypothetical protein